MSQSRSIVGIDLGTTYSLVATLDGGKPIVLPNALGETLTPSAVSFAEDGSVLVGAPARARATTHPLRTALAFKRDMGTDKIFDLGGKRMTPQDLSALVLGALRADAEAALGRAIDEAVVTVPAYFGELQRRATRDAAAIAGLKVERIINEPTAAALAYGLHERSRDVHAVVLDLGGGTFDVTVLEIVEGVVEIQASAGDARLGGEDFDDVLAAMVASRLRTHASVDPCHDARSSARLKGACELAKKRLSSDDRASIALPGLTVGPGKTIDVEEWVSRESAEEAWAPLLDRMRGPIVRALRDASIGAERIDEVLLVGGSTRMPCVARLAAQMFGRLALRKLPPDEAVALGAAVQAALMSNDSAVEDMVVTDVAPFTLGIKTVAVMGDARVAGVFAPILERGTVIPASRVKRFCTVGDLQRQIEVEVFQGEHSLCQENTRLGQCLASEIPPKPAGEESIDVRFTYDLNGILEVEARVTSTGKTSAMVIEPRGGRLTEGQVAAARAAMARLKLHPRDALPNTTALARADALYVELAGPAREQLGQVIGSFRAALERQEPAEVELLRRRLLELVDGLRRG